MRAWWIVVVAIVAMSVSGVAQKRHRQDSNAKAPQEHVKREPKSASSGKMPVAKGTASQELKSLEKTSAKTVRSGSGAKKQPTAAVKQEKEKPNSSINFGGKAGKAGSKPAGRGSNASKGRLKEKRGHR